MDQLDRPKQTSNLLNLIGWLSVCLLAAAWGRMLDDQWQGIWARVGAFGLAAAVGLKSLETARRSREKFVRDLTARTSREGRLAQLNERSAALEVIDRAIRRLTRYVVFHGRRQAANPTRGKSRHTLSQFPLEVIPVKDDGDAFDIGSARSIAGRLRAISSSVVSFEHDEAFAERVVLVTFTVENREQLCFVVDVIWTGTVNDGFASSGAVMAVGVPDDQASKTCLVESN
jgi:hypothetical protein